MDDPASLGVKDLAVINGIALDKIAKYESWGRVDHDLAGAAAKAVDRLSQIEGRLKISVVTVERTPPPERETPPPPALDVGKD